MIIHDRPIPDRLTRVRVHLCHLMSTEPGEKGERELIAFGNLLGLEATDLLQPGNNMAHFILMGFRITNARHHGAIEYTDKQIAELLRSKQDA